MLGDTLFYGFGSEHGAHEDHALHPALCKNLYAFRLALRGIPGAQRDAGVSQTGHFLLDDVGALCVVGDADIFNQNADDARGLVDQAAGGLVGAVIVFVQQFSDPPAGIFIDSGSVIDDPGDCAGRDAGFFCYIVDSFCVFHGFSIAQSIVLRQSLIGFARRL